MKAILLLVLSTLSFSAFSANDLVTKDFVDNVKTCYKSPDIQACLQERTGFEPTQTLVQAAKLRLQRRVGSACANHRLDVVLACVKEHTYVGNQAMTRAEQIRRETVHLRWIVTWIFGMFGLILAINIVAQRYKKKQSPSQMAYYC